MLTVETRSLCPAFWAASRPGAADECPHSRTGPAICLLPHKDARIKSGHDDEASAVQLLDHRVELIEAAIVQNQAAAFAVELHLDLETELQREVVLESAGVGVLSGRSACTALLFRGVRLLPFGKRFGLADVQVLGDDL